MFLWSSLMSGRRFWLRTFQGRKREIKVLDPVLERERQASRFMSGVRDVLDNPPLNLCELVSIDRPGVFPGYLCLKAVLCNRYLTVRYRMAESWLFEELMFISSQEDRKVRLLYTFDIKPHKIFFCENDISHRITTSRNECMANRLLREFKQKSF